MARAIERSVRAADRCFRWGGDEFMVVMSDTARTSADNVLERMAQAVGETCTGRDGRPVELSWGSAELGPGGAAEDLLAAADVALLEQKTEKRR